MNSVRPQRMKMGYFWRNLETRQRDRADVALFFTAKRLHNTAQGRAAHPGYDRQLISLPQRGYTDRIADRASILWNPFGVQGCRGT